MPVKIIVWFVNLWLVWGEERQLGQKADHTKLQALAKEILNDWDAVVAFVKNPELPPTNNEAERALRHAVIARNIGFGTRTPEGANNIFKSIIFRFGARNRHSRCSQAQC